MSLFLMRQCTFDPRLTKMNNFMINEEEELLKLNNIKIDKSPGIDNFHPRVLKEVKLEIKNFLTKLFNLSLTSSYLSLDWKLSTVTAIHKKDLTQTVKLRFSRAPFDLKPWASFLSSIA